MGKQRITNVIVDCDEYGPKYIDGDTGEVLNGGRVELIIDVPGECHSRFAEYIGVKDKKINALEAENNMLRRMICEDVIEDAGKVHVPFIWAYYMEQQKMFPELKMEDISRFVFISTYVEYNSNILTNNGIAMDRTDMNKMLGLTRSVYNAWYDRMSAYGYIKNRNGKHVINNNILNRGRRNMGGGIKATRVFIGAVRELYNNLKPSDHHKMGLVLQLMPYVNPDNNMLVKNPFSNTEPYEPLRLGELAEMFGYSKKHSKRLGNELLGIRFGEDGKRAAAMLVVDNMNHEKFIVMHNSRIFYGGSGSGKHEIANRIFERLTGDDAGGIQ